MKILITNNELNKLSARGLVSLECEICKSTFYRPKNVVLRALKGNRNPCACSKECWKLILSKRQPKKPLINLQCEWCKKEFTRSKSQYNKSVRKNKKSFCSRKCTSTWTQKSGLGVQPTNPKFIELICIHCGNKFNREYRRYMDRQVRNGALPFCSMKCLGNLNQYRKNSSRSMLERWIEEKLSELYPTLNIVYNDRNSIKWELDIYIPSLELAFELNGRYHYEPIYGLHSLTTAIKREGEKKEDCLTKHIDLYIINCKEFSHLNEIHDKKYLLEITTKIEEKLKAVSGVQGLNLAFCTGGTTCSP